MNKTVFKGDDILFFGFFRYFNRNIGLDRKDGSALKGI